jgi:hypothetical protein
VDQLLSSQLLLLQANQCSLRYVLQIPSRNLILSALLAHSAFVPHHHICMPVLRLSALGGRKVDGDGHEWHFGGSVDLRILLSAGLHAKYKRILFKIFFLALPHTVHSYQ